MTTHRGQEKRSFRKELGGGLLLIAIAVALTALGHRTSAVRSLERANLDMLYTVQGSVQYPGIDIVTITPNDYQTIFDQRSPLDPAKVQQIIEGIVDAGAKVVGVDILTDSWSPEVVRGLNSKLPVVWIREVTGRTEAGASLGAVLGGSGAGVCQGPEAIHQVLGVAREFEPAIRVTGGAIVPSFTRVIEARAADPALLDCNPPVHEEEVEPIPFIGPIDIFHRYTAGTILTAMREPEWRKNQVMKGHIVLLGGTYSSSRDYYDTPVQEGMYGVAILANIIGGRTFDEAHWATFLVLDFAVGVILLVLGYYINGIWRLGLITAVVIAISLGSLVLFQYFRLYLSFMPILVGIAIHFLLEQLHHQRKLHRDHARILAENAALLQELHRLKTEEPL